jgi:hypothetical protein
VSAAVPHFIAPRLLTPEEALERFGYKDRKSFFEMCRRRRIRIVRLNARVFRFDPTVIDAWIRRQAA